MHAWCCYASKTVVPPKLEIQTWENEETCNILKRTAGAKKISRLIRCVAGHSNLAFLSSPIGLFSVTYFLVLAQSSLLLFFLRLLQTMRICMPMAAAMKMEAPRVMRKTLT